LPRSLVPPTTSPPTRTPLPEESDEQHAQVQQEVQSTVETPSEKGPAAACAAVTVDVTDPAPEKEDAPREDAHTPVGRPTAFSVAIAQEPVQEPAEDAAKKTAAEPPTAAGAPAPAPTRLYHAASAPPKMLAAVEGVDALRPAPGEPVDSRLAVRRDAINSGPGDAFTAFLIAADTPSVLQSFKELLATTRTPANAGRMMLEKLRERLLPHLKWRQAQLLNKLHERRESGAYKAAAEATQQGRPVLRTLVMGCGPIGLRCAVEMALLGHSVLALDQRPAFTRLNVLHLWDWVSTDLAELGIKALDPSVFASADFAHVGTSQLQHSLLKIALLLGVQIRLGASVKDLADLRAVEPSNRNRRSLDWPADVRLSLDTHSLKAVRLPPTPQKDGGATFSADVLVDATGSRCPLFNDVGFEQITALKSARALGVVCHFYNGKTAKENALPEANWAQQYHTARFKSLKDRGVDLQNIVYYRSTGAFSSAATHYFVMTADADSLAAMGALRSMDVSPDMLCASANVDRDALRAYVRIAVGEFVPELEHAALVEQQGVQIFDFSERKVSNRASVLLDAKPLGGKRNTQVLVTRVGDALQEPFWPEGLGINRGFLHVMDCADLVQGYAAMLHEHGRLIGGDNATEREEAATSLISRREELFTLVKRVSGTNRLTELKPTLDQRSKPIAYAIDPATRYVHLPRSLPKSSY
jgi:hypothetical protein